METPTILNQPNMDGLFIGGTNHDLEGFASGNDFDYKIGEDITFSYKITCPYTASWAIYKDDPEDNAIAEFGEVGNNDHGYEGQRQVRPVRRGETKPGETEFSVTTRMNKPGVVRFDITFKDEAGNTVKYANGNKDAFITTVAIVDFENIKQPIEKGIGGAKPTYYLTASGEKVNMDTDGFLNELRETANCEFAAVERVLRDNAEKIKSFFDNANPGDDIAFGNVVYILCSIQGEKRYFTFRIATNEIVGTTSTGADGLFSDECYKKAAEKYGLPEYNLRPAAGVFAVPKNTDKLDTVSAFFHGYGTARALYDNCFENRLMVNMNSHGMRDELDDAYIANLVAYDICSGGTKGCLLGDHEKTITDPHHLYMYGIILRDYIGYKAGQVLYEILTGKKPEIVMSNGGSMGGWQSFMVTALNFDIDRTYGDIIWNATIGAETTNDYISNFISTGNPAAYYFSSVSAAEHINSTMNKRPSNFKVGLTGGMADHTSPVNGIIAVYNAFTKCPKTIELKQFGEHGFNPVTPKYISKRENLK